MKFNIKIVLRILIIASISLYVLRGVKILISGDFHKTFQDCGVVVSKSADEIRIKHGHRTELYLNVQFEKQGFVSKSVTPTTYFKHYKGDRVCFDCMYEVNKFDELNVFLSVTAIGLGVFIALCLGLIYVFD